MASAKKFGWIEFLTGFAAGSLASVLLNTKGGKKLREELKDDFSYLNEKAEDIRKRLIGKAKNISLELGERSRKFVESSKNFADGKYAGTIEKLENEYYSLRYAIDSAIDNYKNSSNNIITGQSDDDLFIDFEDETLPKFIGMGKRKR